MNPGLDKLSAVSAQLDLDDLGSVQLGAAPLSVAAPEAAPRRLLGRSLRIGAGVLTLLAVGWALAPGIFYVSSSDAVVNARVVSLFSVYDGQVAQQMPALGQAVQVGQTLLTIENPQIDRALLQSLEAKRNIVAQRLAALQQQQVQLATLAGQLRQQVAAYQKASRQNLVLREQELAAAQAAARARLEQAELERQRLTSLARNGAANPLEVQRGEKAWQVAGHEFAQVSIQRQRVQAEIAALAKGVFLGAGDGRNDVPYSAQRLDEVELRRQDLQVQIQQTSEEIQQVASQVVSEESRLLQRGLQRIAAPIQGVIWRRYVDPGSQVAGQTELLQVLDPQQIYVEAVVSRRFYPNIVVGQSVQAEFSDSGQSVPGVVEQKLGPSLSREDRTLAALPPESDPRSFRVIIRLNHLPAGSSPANSFYVGRKVRVWFKRGQANPA